MRGIPVPEQRFPTAGLAVSVPPEQRYSRTRIFNRVLSPILEMMKDEPYSSFLDIIPEPTEEAGRKSVSNGLMYSDISLVLSQYKSALGQFDQKYFYSLIDFDNL